MRISDHRYSRDRFRLDLALRFIRHEARTQTIRAWTGLSDDRIRKMYREFMKEPGIAVSRPRGKSPRQCTFFTRTPQHKDESSLLASLCSLLGALLGTAAAWLLFGGREFMMDQNIYRLLITPRLVATGIGWALGLALAGSVLPAVRAARLQVAQALRAT